MTPDEYDANSDVIMEAIRSGNFISDISGSARYIVDKLLFIGITIGN